MEIFENVLMISFNHNKQQIFKLEGLPHTIRRFCGSLVKFAGGFIRRALTGRAPLTGRTRYKFALSEGAQRVARLV